MKTLEQQLIEKLEELIQNYVYELSKNGFLFVGFKKQREEIRELKKQIAEQPEVTDEDIDILAHIEANKFFTMEQPVRKVDFILGFNRGANAALNGEIKHNT